MAEYLDNDAQWSDPIERASSGESGGVAKWHTFTDGDVDFHIIGDLCLAVFNGKPSTSVYGIKGDYVIPERCKPIGTRYVWATRNTQQNVSLNLFSAISSDAYPDQFGVAATYYYFGFWPIKPIE